MQSFSLALDGSIISWEYNIISIIDCGYIRLTEVESLGLERSSDGKITGFRPRWF